MSEILLKVNMLGQWF